MASKDMQSDSILLVEADDQRYEQLQQQITATFTDKRIRRATCLFGAENHLQAYVPGMVVMPMTLPGVSEQQHYKFRNALRSPGSKLKLIVYPSHSAPAEIVERMQPAC